MTSLNTNLGIITIDEVGNIQSCNTFISRIFGHSSEALCKMNVSGLMPRPYSRFHAQYLKRYREELHHAGGRARVVGDSRGRVVSALHKDGRVFSVRLEARHPTSPGAPSKDSQHRRAAALPQVHEMPDESGTRGGGGAVQRQNHNRLQQHG